MNGDGLLDFTFGNLVQVSCPFCTQPKFNPTEWWYWPGGINPDGAFNFRNLIKMNNPPSGAPIIRVGDTEPLLTLADMNGDGFPDIVYGESQGSPSFQANMGGVALGTPILLSTVTLPSIRNIMIADLDRDGFLDFVDGTASDYKYFFRSDPNHRLLFEVTNPFGGRTSLAYGREYLNQGSIWTVTNQFKLDFNLKGVPGSWWIESYNYSGGEYRGWPWNETRGFAYGKVRHSDLSTTEKWFHQDNFKKGRLRLEERRNNVDVLNTRTTYNYSQTLSRGIYRVDYQGKKDLTVDGDGPQKFLETNYFNHDLYGNPQEKRVSGSDILTRTTTTDFLSNTLDYIVNRPSYSMTSVNGVPIEQTWFNYDNQPNGSTPTKGNLSRKERWFSEGPNPVIQYAYDIYGNQIGLTDAKGNLCSETGFTEHTEYDLIYHVYPIVKTNALCHKFNKTYWGINNSILASDVPSAFNVPGLLATTVDPNNVTTERYWDALSREKATVSPPDTFLAPTQIQKYVMTGSIPSSVTKSSREGVNGGTLDQVIYFSGYGQTIQTKTDSEAPGAWITQDTSYDFLDRISSLSVEYLSNTSKYRNPEVQPKIQVLYDEPLNVGNTGHKTIVTNLDGSVRSVFRKNWVETETNERGFQTEKTYDALGRLIRIKEPIKDAITTYGFEMFDVMGNNIQTIKDAEGNLTTTVFDTLGRKKSHDDPDLGFWQFTYNANGNLKTRIDSKNQLVTFEYDKLDRVVGKIVGFADTTPPVLSGVSTVNVDSSGASIIWTSDELSDSLVEYGTTIAYGSRSPLYSPLVTNHTVVLGGLAGGTLYHYRVVSRDIAGNQAVSEDSVFTTTDTIAPTVPENLIATVVSTSQIDLRWTASTDDVGVAGYKIFRNGTEIGTRNTTLYSDTGLVANTGYTYTVSSYDAAENFSSQSVAANATTEENPPLVSLSATDLSFSGEEAGNSPATQNITISNVGGGSLNWNASATENWLSLSPISGSAPSTLAVSVNTSGLLAGTYTESIVLVAAEASNTPQNITVTLTITTPTPVQGTDLIVTSVSGPSTGAAGGTITIANTATNQGTNFSYQVYVGMYLSADANITAADTFLGHRYINTILLGGESSAANTAVFIPSDLTPGSYYIGSIVDSSNYQIEVDESNNGLVGNTITIIAGVDLVMSSVGAPNTGGEGQSIIISDTVTNQGPVSTYPFYVGLFLSRDENITTSDTMLARRYVNGGLTGGASNSANTIVFIPSNIAPGTYYIGALADESTNQTEGDETNNSLAGNTIIITASQP